MGRFPTPVLRKAVEWSDRGHQKFNDLLAAGGAGRSQ